MIRSVPLALAMLTIAGCDRPAPEPRVPKANPNAGFDNAAAARSVMQAKVIAESIPEPAPSPTPPPPPTGATVLFESGAALDDTARAAIDAILAAPGLPAEARWVLRGSSDTGGSNAANLTTSRRRAVAVEDYLVEKGVAADRIEVIALGDGRPAAPNVKLDGTDDPEGRARNRRVDIEIVPPAVPPIVVPETLPSPTPTATASPEKR